ncbi:hypothetical protein GOB14_11875 [Sinorhizobium meliloti]|nr:hypothetical protein [Sinorhizobium meliloti]
MAVRPIETALTTQCRVRPAAFDVLAERLATLAQSDRYHRHFAIVVFFSNFEFSRLLFKGASAQNNRLFFKTLWRISDAK